MSGSTGSTRITWIAMRVLAIAAFASALAPSLAAQGSTRIRMGRAADAPPPQPVSQRPTVHVVPQVYYTVDGYVVVSSPYIVLDDGSVLVNFGGGYERVLRQCAPVQPAPTQPDPWGRDALGRIQDPPGIAAMKAGTRGWITSPIPQPQQVACYRPEQGGHLRMLILR